MLEVGVGLDPDVFFFNLRPRQWAKDPRAAWMPRAEFRRALSHAVDREAFANTVYLGAAVPVHGPVTPGKQGVVLARRAALPLRSPGSAATAAGPGPRQSRRRRLARRRRRHRSPIHRAHLSRQHRPRARRPGAEGEPGAGRRRRGRRAAGTRRAGRADAGGHLRRHLLQLPVHRHRSGDAARLLAQLGHRAHLEHLAAVAGHGVGAPHRRDS